MAANPAADSPVMFSDWLMRSSKDSETFFSAGGKDSALATVTSAPLVPLTCSALGGEGTVLVVSKLKLPLVCWLVVQVDRKAVMSVSSSKSSQKRSGRPAHQ